MSYQIGDLKPFSPSDLDETTCPKCLRTSSPPKVEHLILDETIDGRVTDCLGLTCTTCGYEQRMKTADA